MFVLPFEDWISSIKGKREPVNIVAVKIEEDLHHAQMDLLKAQREREYWQAMEIMLIERVKRLKDQDLVGVIQ